MARQRGKPRKIKLRWKDALLLLALLPAAAGSYWGLHRITVITRAGLENTLSSVLLGVQQALRIWSRDMLQINSALAGLPLARDLSVRILGESDGGKGSPPRDALRRFKEEYGEVARRNHYLAIVLISPDGEQVAATDERRIGGTRIFEANPELIKAALAGSTMLSAPYLNIQEGQGRAQGEMVVVSPVQDTHERTIGVFAIVLDPAADFTAITRVGRIGETGETYAIDSAGRMISESRFRPELERRGILPPGAPAILSVDVKEPGTKRFTTMAQSVISRQAGKHLEGYRDYRGVPVIGAWLWDEELGFGLATELDHSEAYASLRLTRQLVLIMLGIVLASAAVVMSALLRDRRTLENTLRERDEFASIASHELRSPVTALSLQFDLLSGMLRRSATQPPSTERVSKILAICKTQIERLDGLISDLLDVARIREGKYELDLADISLESLLDSVLDRFRARLEASGRALHVRVEDETTGHWDQRRLEQVLTNLLSNAVKYGGQGPIAVSTRIVGKEVEINVTDQGIGITPQDQARIFDRFERAVSARQFGGLGLGLYISRKIVESHGGSISVHSEPGKGSTFTVRLPLRPLASAA